MFDVYISKGDPCDVFALDAITVCFREMKPDTAAILANEAIASGLTAVLVTVSPIE